MPPAQPTSDIHICNLALDRIGQREIASISAPTSKEEVVCARHYSQTRRELLESFVFNFSKKLVTLTVNAEIPVFGFAAAYALPNDFLRLLALGDYTINEDVGPGLFDISNGFIYTDSGETDEDDNTTLNLAYISDATVVGKYNPLFIELFKLKLAQNISYKFTLKASLLRDLEAEYEMVAVRAAAIQGQQVRPRRVERSRWVAARRGGGQRDNTRLP